MDALAAQTRVERPPAPRQDPAAPPSATPETVVGAEAAARTRGAGRATVSPTAVAALTDAFHQGRHTEAAYHALLAECAGFPLRATIRQEEVNAEFVENIPIAYVRRHGLLGVNRQDGCLGVAMAVPAADGVLDHLAAVLRLPAVVELAPAAVIQQATDHAYAGRVSDFTAVLDTLPGGEASPDSVVTLEDGDLLDTASRAPVVKLVNMILFEAAKRRASDVHLQPYSDHVQVRYRIDGLLYDYLELPGHLLDEVVSRVKVIGRMDIAEKRLAQDGRTTVTIGRKSIDLRISVIPTSYGERVVLRLLDKSARLYELSELGMGAVDRARFTAVIQKTHGIVLVSGPTGSGKSTTLYAALQHLNYKEKNILTLEDPIEYQLPGISQTQVSQKKGMTFATGLRAVLRQDPDVIMVGEIRDEETARMAMQSSLTGHLVFSTLHTNDAAGAVTRLLDLEIEPYLVASSLLAVLAQRLVRNVCPDCHTVEPLAKEDCGLLGLAAHAGAPSVPRAVGCPNCGTTGYFGRQGIFELLIVDEAVRELVVGRAKASAMKRKAVEAGMTTLRQDAIRKLLDRRTTLEEVLRTSLEDSMMDLESDGAECGTRRAEAS